MRALHVSRRQFLGGMASVATLGARPPARAAASQPSPPAPLPSAGSLTDVGGLRVGHFTDPRRPTGCTAILFDQPATAGAHYDGSAPGDTFAGRACIVF